jgi:hypothetical protein
LVINNLLFSSPDILIETDAKGRGNLDFSIPAEKKGSADQPGPAPAATDNGSTYQITLLEITIKNGVVAHHNRSTGKTESIEIESLTVLPDKKTSTLLAIRLAAKAQGQVIKINGTVGKLATAIAGKPWPIHLQGAIDGLALTAEGSIANLLSFRGLNLQLTAQGEEVYKMAQLAQIAKPEITHTAGPFKLTARLSDTGNSYTLTEVEAEAGQRDTLQLTAKGTVKDLGGRMDTELALTMESENLGRLSQLAGTEIPALGPTKLSGRLCGSGANWKLTDIRATVAGSDLSGELAVDMTKGVHLSGKLAATTFNLNNFIDQTAQAGEKPTPQPTQSAAGDGRIFSDKSLPFPALRPLDLDLAIEVGTLITDDLQWTDLLTHLHVRGGRLALKPFRAGLAGGNIEGEASLDVDGTVPVIVVHLTARQVELGQLVDPTVISGGKSNLQVDLKGQGESVRALMASLTGETVLSIGAGKIQHMAAHWASGDLLFQLLDVLNPLAKSEKTTSLSCAVARFTIVDGIASTNKGLAARTDKVDVVGSGTIDLRSERLDLGIRPSPRHGVGLSLSSPFAGMTRVRGTLARPAIGIDTEGTLRTAASVGVAAATGGLSMLGEKLFDKVSADSDPCRTALGQAPTKPAKGQPSPKTPPQNQDSGGFLQDLFGR